MIKRLSQWLHDLFEAAVLLKFIDGILEIGGAVLLALVSEGTISRLVIALTQHELSQDPHDFFATHLLRSATHLTSSAKWFGATYLLLHGVIKVGIVLALWAERRWAYPAAILFLSIFAFYQVYRIGYSHSMGLVALTAFDLIMIWLTLKEAQARGVTWR